MTEADALAAILKNDTAEARRILAEYNNHWDLEIVEEACKDLLKLCDEAHDELEKREERERVIAGAKKMLAQ